MSSLIKLPVNRATDLTFDLALEGNYKTIDEIRLLLELPQYSLVIKGTTSQGTVKFQVPELSNLIKESTTCVCKMEFVIDGERLVPALKETIELEVPFQAKVSVTEAVVKKPVASVKFTEAVVAPQTTENPVENVEIPRSIKPTDADTKLLSKLVSKVK